MKGNRVSIAVVAAVVIHRERDQIAGAHVDVVNGKVHRRWIVQEYVVPGLIDRLRRPVVFPIKRPLQQGKPDAVDTVAARRAGIRQQFHTALQADRSIGRCAPCLYSVSEIARMQIDDILLPDFNLSKRIGVSIPPQRFGFRAHFEIPAGKIPVQVIPIAVCADPLRQTGDARPPASHEPCEAQGGSKGHLQNPASLSFHPCLSLLQSLAREKVTQSKTKRPSLPISGALTSCPFLRAAL